MNHSNNNKPSDDYEEPDVKEIIPEDEEYYTLNLKRNFENYDDDDGDDMVDIVSEDEDEPIKSASYYEGSLVTQDNNLEEGNVIAENNVVDEDSDVQVGEPGHWGIDDKNG